jgi:hypothetical protein
MSEKNKNETADSSAMPPEGGTANALPLASATVVKKVRYRAVRDIIHDGKVFKGDTRHQGKLVKSGDCITLPEDSAKLHLAAGNIRPETQEEAKAAS